MITDSYDNDYKLAVKTFDGLSNADLIDMMLAYQGYSSTAGNIDVDEFMLKIIAARAL